MRKVLIGATAVAALLPLAAATPAQAGRAAGPVPIATGLSNPRQLTLGPDGALYVAAAGSGAVGAFVKGACFGGAEGKVCSGNTGAVLRIGHPATATGTSVRQVSRGELSIAAPDGSGATGIDAVTFDGRGKPYAIMTWAPPRVLPRRLALQSGQLLTQSAGGRLVPVVNVASYSLSHPLKGHERDSNPYGIAGVGRTLYIADAGNNTVLKWRDGKLTTLHTFPYRHGTTGLDTVPTSIAVGPDGNLYVGTLGSLAPNAGKVYVVNPRSGRVLRTIGGLTSVTAVAVGGDGTVYAAELLAGCAAGDTNCTPGRIAVIPRTGARQEVAVPLPGGVAVDGSGHVYASVLSTVAGGGQVWRVS